MLSTSLCLEIISRKVVNLKKKLFDLAMSTPCNKRFRHVSDFRTMIHAVFVGIDQLSDLKKVLMMEKIINLSVCSTYIILTSRVTVRLKVTDDLISYTMLLLSSIIISSEAYITKFRYETIEVKYVLQKRTRVIKNTSNVKIITYRYITW